MILFRSLFRKTLPCFFLLLYLNSNSQTNAFSDYIEAAKRNSYPVLYAQKETQLAELNYKSVLLNTKPIVSFYGNVPAYNKDNYAVTQPDGSIRFLPRSQNYSNVGVGISQPIVKTGGTISVNTDLYRFDNFTAKTKQYNSTPFFVRLTQPLFKYNAYKWDKKIAPLKLEEAKQGISFAVLESQYEVCKLFFNVVEAQADQDLAAVNLWYITTNLAIENRRKELDASTEDKVVQLQMQQIINQKEEATASSNIKNAILTLHAFVSSVDTAIKKLKLPEIIPVLSLNKETLITFARKNHLQYFSFERKKIDAESKIEEAKKQGKQIDIVASYGLNNAATDLANIYQNPQDQQRFSIGFRIPIADWGRQKNTIAIATVVSEQIEITNKQEDAMLITDITRLVNELPLLQSDIRQSLLLDTLSQKRFKVANILFQSGKISLLELQAAQNQKDGARRGYISSLRKFWEAYYLLRLKTGGHSL